MDVRRKVIKVAQKWWGDRGMAILHLQKRQSRRGCGGGGSAGEKRRFSFYPSSCISGPGADGLQGIAAAAAKSLQSCPTLCDPVDGSSTGSAIPGILQARTLEWVAISFSNA